MHLKVHGAAPGTRCATELKQVNCQTNVQSATTVTLAKERVGGNSTGAKDKYFDVPLAELITKRCPLCSIEHGKTGST